MKKKKKIENGYNLKIWILKIYIRIIIHYTDIDPSVNTRPHISCL